MSTAKRDTDRNSYEFVQEHHTDSNWSKSSAHMQDVTEEILSGNESIEYEDFLSSLEETYDLEGLSEYENPKEVRISYHVSGLGSKWNETIRIEVDEAQEELSRIPDFFKEKIESSMENWSLPGQEYFATEETHTHSYPDREIPKREMEDFINSFQEIEK